jgi:hypothetical protein
MSGINCQYFSLTFEFLAKCRDLDICSQQKNKLILIAEPLEKGDTLLTLYCNSFYGRYLCSFRSVLTRQYLLIKTET